MGVRYTICHWAINRTDPQNSLSMTLDVPLQTGQTHLFLCYVLTGNYLQQLLLGMKLQTRSSLEHRKRGSRQPQLKTGENGSVLCLLTKLYSVSSLVIHKSTTDCALLEFSKTL